MLKSLKTFKKNKSPGNDGLPAEFYMVFWNKIGDMYFDSICEGMEKGELSTTQKQTLIRLIGKKDRDKQQLKNWRPLNMINCDVKIFTKALTLRALPCLTNIIHPNQTAYVKGRFIGEGIKTIEGVIDYIKENKLDAYILAIDFEKAFDSLEWGFLWSTLKAFGFPDFYINCIKTVYTDIKTCVINGSTTSSFFQVTRSARQGDPLSAIIFIIALEVLLIKIRHNKDVRGLKIGEVEIKLSAYADDLTNFLADSRSVEALFRELNDFSRYSGLRCNADKTEAMKLGRSNIDHGNGEIRFVNAMKVTGIYFSFDPIIQYEKKYTGIIEKIQNLIKIWKQRDISLLGRVQVAKTYIFSQVRFVTNFVEPSQAFLNEFKSIVINYIWNDSEK